ncbi:unnamed protein product [Spodoptera exigua]|nr:unnamed protein product [Spodoptera exigua]
MYGNISFLLCYVKVWGMCVDMIIIVCKGNGVYSQFLFDFVQYCACFSPMQRSTY